MPFIDQHTCLTSQFALMRQKNEEMPLILISFILFTHRLVRHLSLSCLDSPQNPQPCCTRGANPRCDVNVVPPSGGRSASSGWLVTMTLSQGFPGRDLRLCKYMYLRLPLGIQRCAGAVYMPRPPQTCSTPQLAASYRPRSWSYFQLL